MRAAALVTSLVLASSATAQQIWDIWTTTWDRQSLFTRTSNSAGLPINFGNPGPTGDADIIVDDTQIFQDMDGFGATLTDSSAQLLSQLKSQNSDTYWQLINQLFNPGDGVDSAALTCLRLPLGATDFSNRTWTYDMVAGDNSLSNFRPDNAPAYVWSTLTDILSVNSILRIFLLPWSPPGWMKTGSCGAGDPSSDMRGGNLNGGDIQLYANYLFKSVQAVAGKGYPMFAVGIQNEPLNCNPTYPSTSLDANTEVQVGQALRSLLNNNNLGYVRIIGYEHNWDNVDYPETLAQQAPVAFSSVAFHCYAGDQTAQSTFHDAFENIDIFHTECTGVFDTDWWSNIKWYIDHLFVGVPENWGRTAMMWNIALDPNGQPMLPGSNSCSGSACRGVVTIDGGSYSLNEEYYVMAQAARALVPRDVGGPFGTRIGVTIGGTLNWGLRVGAYQTKRVSSTDWNRYSLIVLNWHDHDDNQNWDPQTLTATIEFRGQQATYTFPVGVTTLWWYAASSSAQANATDSPPPPLKAGAPTFSSAMAEHAQHPMMPNRPRP